MSPFIEGTDHIAEELADNRARIAELKAELEATRTEHAERLKFMARACGARARRIVELEADVHRLTNMVATCNGHMNTYRELLQEARTDVMLRRDRLAGSPAKADKLTVDVLTNRLARIDAALEKTHAG
jgi:chromosome segregation ATPase